MYHYTWITTFRHDNKYKLNKAATHTRNWLHVHLPNCFLVLTYHRPSLESPKLWLQKSPATPILAEITGCACQWCWAETETFPLAVQTQLNHSVKQWEEKLQQRAAKTCSEVHKPGIPKSVLRLCYHAASQSFTQTAEIT